MKLCIVAAQAYPLLSAGGAGHAGGAELQLCILAKFLVSRGVDVDMIVGEYGQAAEEWWHGIRVVKGLSRPSSSPLLGLARFVPALLRSRADVYFASCAGPTVGVSAIVSRMMGRRFVYRTAHEIDCDGSYARQNGIRGKLYGFGLRRADAVVTQNEEHRLLLAKQGVHAAIIRNAFYMTRGEEAERSRDIDGLWVGRCDAWKNPGLFLDLVEALHDRSFLMVCPRGNDSTLFEEIAARARKLANLQFVAGAPFEQTEAYFHRARLLVGTSDHEGFPNTYLQAAMASTPIMSFKVDPDRFITRWAAGMVAEGDYRAMLDGVRDLLASETRLRVLATNAHSYVLANHDIVTEGPKWLDLFQRLSRRAAAPIGNRPDVRIENE